MTYLAVAVAVARRRALVVFLGLSLIGAACTGGGTPKRSPTPRQPGGTVRIGSGDIGNSWDPQHDVTAFVFDEIQRCCLARTLLSYNGQSTDRGGTVLRPDVAAGLPTISPDGLTWTFRLKRRLHYAPSLQHTEIVAQDFVRAMERELSPTPAYLAGSGLSTLGEWGETFGQLIVGADAYTQGKTDTISGLETPDAHTLKFRLTKPTGELGYLLALSDAAPIPPEPQDTSAKFGVATGHEGDYGYFQAASGPYMIEGADTIDYALPAMNQSVPTGVQPQSLTLVRNPSWDPATDHLRKASVDRIALTNVTGDDAAKAIQAGDLDTVLGFADLSESVWQRYKRSPDLQNRAFVTTFNFERYLSMNLAMPPLDDIHVRKAISYVIDKAALLKIAERTSEFSATIATHLALDNQEENLLLNYDPYGTPSHTGNLEAAKREMALSKYDTNGDGICDASVCSGVRLLVQRMDPTRVAAAPVIRADLRRIGLDLRLDPVDEDPWAAAVNDPGPSKVAINLFGQAGDYPSPQAGFEQFRSDSITDGGDNEVLMGATPQQLRGWDYSVTSVPDVDGRIDQCVPQVFQARVRCWADLDQYLMEKVVPFVPLWSQETGRIVSDRVASFSFDQGIWPPPTALDQITLTEAARRETSPPVATVSTSPAIGAPIPDGVYRFTITKADLYRFDPNYDPDSVNENTGTTTITLSGGHWRSTQTSPNYIYHPVNSGIYYGSGSTVTFVGQLPPTNGNTIPDIRWNFDGRFLRFKLLSCEGLTDPNNPHSCDDFRVPYEAHPWEKIG